MNRVRETPQKNPPEVLIPRPVQHGGFAQGAQCRIVGPQKLKPESFAPFLIPSESLGYVIDYLRA